MYSRISNGGDPLSHSGPSFVVGTTIARQESRAPYSSCRTPIRYPWWDDTGVGTPLHRPARSRKGPLLLTGERTSPLTPTRGRDPPLSSCRTPIRYPWGGGRGRARPTRTTPNRQAMPHFHLLVRPNQGHSHSGAQRRISRASRGHPASLVKRYSASPAGRCRRNSGVRRPDTVTACERFFADSFTETGLFFTSDSQPTPILTDIEALILVSATSHGNNR